ncbi:MAG: YigZ family protein [candidate division Zixibacteria bacterium]|nr:YigZ family protein [candidate division Zixibacteria bacterium]
MKETKNQADYLSIKESKRDKFLVKGSKFIATAIPVGSEEKAELWLKKIKKEFHDATHNPYAYVLRQGEIQKSTDDGEPSGTAGRQILSAILSQNLKDILIVVTRYFGGVKLGTGGLSKAYYESALRVLRSCVFIKKELKEELVLLFPKKYFDRVQMILNKEKVKVKKLAFGDRARMEIEVSKGIILKLKDELMNKTRGEIEFERV